MGGAALRTVGESFQAAGTLPRPLGEDGAGAADGADAPLVVGTTARERTEQTSKGLANVPLTSDELRSAARCFGAVAADFPAIKGDAAFHKVVPRCIVSPCTGASDEAA